MASEQGLKALYGVTVKGPPTEAITDSHPFHPALDMALKQEKANQPPAP